MFQPLSHDEADQKSEGGTRPLFTLGHYEFRDSLDGDGNLHHFVLDSSETTDEPTVYETNRRTMYEFMARYLAGEYEKSEYDLERSPAQEALLDTLEIAAARARSGETDWEFEDLDVTQDWAEIEEDLEEPDR